MTRIALFLAVVALTCPGVALAQNAHLSWHGCTTSEAFDIEPYTPTDHVLTVLIDGVDGDFEGIDVTIGVYDYCTPGGQFIPKAWQFQPGGCREGLLTIARPASVDGCPGLVPGSGFTLDAVTTDKVTRYLGMDAFATVPALLIHVRTAFPMRHLVAGQRYVVAQVTIPMAGTTSGPDPSGEACGCGGAGRVLAIESAKLDGGTPFQLFPVTEAFWVDFVRCAVSPKGPPALDGEPDPPSCLVTPARAQSWGAVKAGYR